MLPDSPYVESRNGGHYLTGTRIGLDVVTHAFRRGRTPEDIFRAYPSIGSLASLYGVITFILEHPKEIDACLNEQDRLFLAFQQAHPLPPDMLEPFERARDEEVSKLA
jgi:hypothetical protein